MDFEPRMKVNEALRNGWTYIRVCKLAADLGYPGLTENNVGNWCEGTAEGGSGYKDWLKEQERKQDIKLRSQAARDLVMDLKGAQCDLEEANSIILADRIQQVLDSVDTETLKSMMADNPKEFFSLAQTINTSAGERSRRIKVELELTKYRDLVAESKARMEALLKPKGSGAITKATIKQLQDELKLL
jgi:hypothetical protein